MIKIKDLEEIRNRAPDLFEALAKDDKSLIKNNTSYNNKQGRKNIMITLQEFCEDTEKNGELIRCCSCFNTLTMSGKYEIQPIEDRTIPFLPDAKVEGLVCENCVKVGRKAVKAVVIIQEKDNPQTTRVTYVNIDDLAKPGQTTGAEVAKLEPKTEDEQKHKVS